MARHKRESYPAVDSGNHWATEKAIEDGFAVEVDFLFESINVSTREGMKGGSRLSIFILAEANKAANGQDRLAYRNDAALGRIVDAQCAKDQEVFDNPNCFEARKRKQELLARIGERFVAMASLLSSLAIHRQYQDQAGQEKYIKVIKPYWSDDRPWKRAKSRLNTDLMKRGVKRDSPVGNGKPPLEGRFKESGNLEGRPPKESGWAAIKTARDRPLKAKTRSGRDVTLDRRQHKLASIYRRAMEGDASARRELMMLIEYLHEQKLLVEPPRKRRARKLELNETQTLIFNKAIACAFEWSLNHFREQYGRVYGGVVDFQARIGLSDEDTALMDETDATNQTAHADAELPPGQSETFVPPSTIKPRSRAKPLPRESQTKKVSKT